MKWLWAYILVFLLAATPLVEMVAVIPIGTVAGLHLVPVTFLAFLGNWLTVLLVIAFVDQIKTWLSRRKKQKEEDQESKRSLRAKRLWTKYGLPGLAFIGPLLVGSHITAFMSVSLGGTRRRTTLWMTISLLVWGVVTAVLTILGVDFANLNTEENGFLIRLFENES